MKDLDMVKKTICHLVYLGDKKKKPKYCERKESDSFCTCCPQCCTCGG